MHRLCYIGKGQAEGKALFAVMNFTKPPSMFPNMQ
jgi:hypothetical protein